MKQRSASRSIGGLLALTAGLGLAAAALGARIATLVPSAMSPAARVETWVELAVVATAALAAAWVATGAALGLAVVGAARAGRRWRLGEAALRRTAPVMVLRLVRTGVGVSLGAGLVLAPTAAFAAAPEPAPASVSAVADVSVEGGPASAGIGAVTGRGGIDLSWRPTAMLPPAAETSVASPTASAVSAPAAAAAPAETAPTARVVTTATRTAPPPGETVVVHRGDTLWDLAAASLGGDPTDAQVLAETVRWHEANRAVIGDDPDLLLPGQTLVRPA